MNFQIPTILLLVLFLSGCATNQLEITYRSDPPGAVLYDDSGQKKGYAPLTLRYNISEEDKQRGSIKVRGTSVQWASGATARINTLSSDLRNGFKQTFTFKRPTSAPGLDTDLRFALELEKMELMRRQTAASEEAAYEARRARQAAEEARDAAQSSSSGPILIDTGKSLKTCTRIGSMIDCL